jgi:hypothetical protein
MPKGGTTVEGARELERTAHKAADDLGDMASSQARAGDYVAQTARSLAPTRSGRLAGTIRAQSAGVAATVTAGGPGVDYAGPIHFGWPARNIASQPFLTNALEQAESSVVNIYEDGVDRVVARIHGK